MHESVYAGASFGGAGKDRISKMKVKILRQQAPFTESYWETFDADVPGDMSVAALIDYLNYRDDIVDENGKKTTRIGWECSCLQGVCGSCAMVINDVPALACETFVKDMRGDVLTIRPLRKFPVIHDLVVDRSQIQENLKQTDVCIGEYQPDFSKDEKEKQERARPPVRDRQVPQMWAVPGSVPELCKRQDILRRALCQRLLPGGLPEQGKSRRDQLAIRGTLWQRLLQISFLHGCLPYEDPNHRRNGGHEPRLIL